MMAFSQQTKPLSIFKILCEALKLPFKNLNLILPILIFAFLATSLLFIFADLSINPLLIDLTSKIEYMTSLDPNSPEFATKFAKISDVIFKEMKELLSIEALYLLISLVVSSFVTIAMFRAFSMSCSNKLSAINENGWKGPIITTIYGKLLSWGYAFLLGVVLGIFILIGRGSMVFMVSGVIIFLLGQIFYLCLLMVWLVSVVISVVEDGCYGWNAILKAKEVTKGRRGQGTMLMLIQLALGVAFMMAYKMVSSNPPSSLIARTGIAVVYATVGVAINVFLCTMVMVFYCDCKKSNGGKGMAMDSSSVMYSLVPTAALIEDQV